MSETRTDRQGVAGWLLLFVLTLAVVSPLRLATSVYTDLYEYGATGDFFGEAWGTIQAFEWGLVAARVAILWYVTFRLFVGQTWSTVLLTVGAIWLVGPVGVLVETAGVGMISGTPLGAMFGHQVGAFVQTLFYCTIWTSYLLLSKRVANTYRRRAAPEVGKVFD